MIRRTLSTFLLMMLFLSAKSQGGFPLDVIPDRPPTRVYYSVFVQSFYDSNNDGIGDLKGLTSKLDYLQDLGVGGLWLLPVHPSPTYHKYDVTDYYGIHPDYGTLDDYKTLIREAHKRNIRVLLDLVPNHTSNLHPWFQAASSDPKNEYREYYVWSSDTNLFKKDRYQWHQVRDESGKKLKGERYYGFFWWEMPNLNYESKKVRKEMVKVARYWVEEVGVDGFRLDAIRFLYPEDKLNKNLEWWADFRKEIDKTNKNVFTVGEIWGPSEDVAPYLNHGINAGFNFEFSDTIRMSIKKEKDIGIVATWNKINRLFFITNPNYEDAIFLTNHDMNRIMSELAGNMDKARIAASLLLTLPGNPFIYYGEEIGMLGEKPDEYIREPFLWNVEGADKGQTTWEVPYLSSSQTVKPLYYQTDDHQSLFNHYKPLIHLRNSSLPLSRGLLRPLNLNNPKVVAFFRSWEAETVIVLINLSSELQTLSWPMMLNVDEVLYGTSPVFKKGGSSVYLQPYSTFILKLKI